MARRVEMVMHVMQMNDNRSWNETHVTVELEARSVIRLGEDTRVAQLWVALNLNWRRTVTLSRRERMVARNIADVSLLFAVVVRRRTFFQENPSIMFFRDVIVRCAIQQKSRWSHTS